MARIIDEGGSFSSISPQIINADGNAVEITDAALLFNADFSRSGNDLVLVGADGKTIIIVDYFITDQTADLVSPDGAVLAADVVAALAGPLAPGQYAQTGIPEGSKAIGQVETLTGTATATRKDGTVVELKVGTHVFQGDIIQTGDGSSLGITFLDQTVFSISDNARMILNELVYDPGGSSNSMLVNLVQGGFVFVAGQIAPTGDMKVQTPVATMGIRGTTPTVFVADNGTVAFSIIPDPGPEGRIGSYVLFDAQGQVIGSVEDTGLKLILTSAGGEVQELPKTGGDFNQDQQLQAQVYSVFNSLQGRIDSGQSPVELNSTGSDPDTNPDSQSDQSQNTNDDGSPEITGSINTAPDSGGAASSETQGTSVPVTTTTAPLDDGTSSLNQTPAVDPLGGASPGPIAGGPPPSQPLTDPTDNPLDTTNQLFGTPGTDFLTGTPGADQLQGFGGADNILGQGGNDILLGGPGVDFLDGGAGNDIIDGGLGADELTGGTGADTFILGADTPDFITDFSVTEDTLDLSNILGPNFNIANLSDFVTLQETGSSTVRIDVDGAANGRNFVDVAVLNDIFAGDTLNFIFDNQGSTGSVVSADRNIAPVAQDDTFATDEDTGFSGNVFADNGNGVDVDPENDQLIVTAVNGVAASVGSQITLVSGALLTLNADGTFTYDPNGQFEGLNSTQNDTDTFDYTLNDGNDGFDTGTVTIDIAGVNDAPVTGVVQLAATEDGGPVTASFNASDVDVGGSVVSFAIVNQPAAGSVVNNNDGTFTYSPGTALQSLAAGVTQDLVFTFTATDNDGAVSAPGNATVTVTGVNDAPIANDDRDFSGEDTILIGDVFEDNIDGEDEDIDINDVFSVVAVNDNTAAVGNQITLESGALLTLDADGIFAYDPNGQFEDLNVGDRATDTYTYTIQDSQGATDSATVTIIIRGANDAPVITSSSTALVAENTSAVQQVTAADIDTGSQLTFSLTGNGPDDAFFVINNNGILNFQVPPDFENPLDVGNNNIYNVEVAVSDGTNTTTQLIAVSVSDVNDNAPVITSATIINVAENTSAVQQVTASDVDTVGGQTFSLTGNGPDNALFVIDGSGNLSFQVPPDFENPLDAGNDNVYDIEIQVFDGVNTTTQAITVNVDDANDTAPVITSPASASVVENTTFALQVVATDVDTVGVQTFALTGNGADDALFAIDGLGNLSFQSAPDFENPLDAGADNIYDVQVAVSDGINTTTQAVAVNVTNVNEAPVARDDAFNTDEETDIFSNVLVDNGLGPDFDPENDTLIITAVNGQAADVDIEITLNSGASLLLSSNGDFLYDTNISLAFEFLPVGGLFQDSFTYTITDGNGGFDTATAIINISGVNDAPAAVDDGLATTENAILNGDVFADNGNGADSDIDNGDILSVLEINGVTADVGIQTALASGALLTLNSDGTFAYDPNGQFDALNLGQTATDTFNYTIDDGNGGTDTATVTITVNGLDNTNTAPVAQDDFLVTDEDNFLEANVFADNSNGLDFDIDGDTLTVTQLEDVDFTGFFETDLSSGAFLSIDGGGNIQYDPLGAFDFLGQGDAAEDSFTYTISDGNGGISSAIVFIDVQGLNDAPIAIDDALSTNEDTVLNGDVFADNGNGIDFEIDDIDVFAVSQINGNNASVGSQITLLSGALLTLNADGTFAYDPNGQFNTLNLGQFDTDTFTYTIDDGNGGFDTATVTITVNGITANQPPTAVDDSGPGFSTDEDNSFQTASVLGNDFDPDLGDTLTVISLDTALTTGLVTQGLFGQFIYDPNGQFESLSEEQTTTDTFAYTIDDGNGNIDTATVTIDLGGVNDAPIALDDTLATDEDTILNGDVFADNGSGIDSDVDNGDVFTVTRVDGISASVGTPIALASGALLTLNADGTFAYDPNGQFDTLGNGQAATDSFNYTIDDGKGGTDIATATVTITGVNDAPVAQDDALTTNEDTVLNGDVLADNGNGIDDDIDSGDVISILEINGVTADVGVQTALVSGALLTLNTDGTFAYDPNGQFESLGNGQTTTDSFIYTIDDGNGGTDTATATITITGVNDAPIAQDDDFFGDEDFGFNGNVLDDNGFGADFDPENDPRTVTAINGNAASVGVILLLASGALLTLNADGSFAYDPNGAFENLSDGELDFDSFDYTISDGNGGFSTATANIEILGENDAPFLLSDPGEQFATVNSSFFTDFNSFDLFFDIDDFDTLNLDAILDNGDPLPNWLSFNGEDFFGTPTATDGGTITIELTAFDDFGESDFTTFDITVLGDITGTAGNDNLQGNALANLIQGFGGNDRIEASLGGDVIDGGLGTDTISFINTTQGVTVNLATQSSSSTETGNDLLISIENVIGGSGNDNITGDATNNVLTGGAGFDLLTGGGGADTFAFTDVSIDTVADFTSGQDQLDLAALLGGNFIVQTANDFVRAVESAGSTIIRVDSDGLLNGENFADVAVLTNVALGSTIDFIFDNLGNTTSVVSNVATVQGAIELSALDGTNGFVINGVAAVDLSGGSVSSAGDINGDGFDDVIIGASAVDSNSSFNTGASYVVFGQAGGFGASFELSSLNGTNGFVINGVAGGDNSGISVSAAGDINGDGIADIIIGAEQADPNGTASGASYVVFGQAGGFGANLDLSTLNGTNGFVLNGIDTSDLSGGSVSSAGDINGDGIGDLIIGAERGAPNGIPSAGESYVVFGQAGGFGASFELSTLAAGNGSAGFVINGIDSSDRSGISVSSAGDFNGDGIGDLIIGARDADQIGGTNAGEAYVVFGSDVGFGASLNLSTLNGTNGFVLNGIDGNDTTGNSVSSAGDINGDGFDDLIIAAFGGDPNGGQTGETYVVFGQAASFGASFELSTLAAGNGSTGFVINGIDLNDRSGNSVSSAGDFNGDGFDDLIIGAQRGDPNGLDAGESYVVFGKATGFGASLELSALDGTNGFIINGIDASDISGGSVSAAGDINNDGFDDLIVGASQGDPNGTNSGESYIIFGSAFGSSSAPVNTTGTAAADTLIGGLGNDLLVGNGGADVIRGGAGDDVIAITDDFFARIDGGTGIDTLRLDGAGFSPNSPGGDGIITGIERIDITGSGDNTIVVSKPDVFNITDERSGGIASITVVGDAGDAVSFEDLGWSNAGQITIGADTFNRIVNGNAEVLVQDTVGTIIPGAQAAVFELSTLNGANGLVLNGIDAGDFSGRVVSSAGDFNGDGFDDVIIGAPGAQPNGTQSGEAYVVFGQAGGFGSSFELSSLDGTNGFVLNGINVSDFAGGSVSAGDINGDGFDDLIIGAEGGDTNNPNTGETYVVFGQARGFAASLELSALDGTNGFVINGIDPDDLSGGPVSSAGDINGDGFDDVIIGARFADPNGNQTGESYVVFGQAGGFGASFNLSTLDGTNGFVINGIDAVDRSGNSVSSAGDINGDGFDDVIIGASLADPNGSGSGESYVVFGQAGGFSPSINLSSLDGTNGFVINGINITDNSGISVSSAGDFNGDGFDDVIIGATGGDTTNFNAGESYVVFGRAGGFGASFNLSTLDGTNGFVINGIDAGDQIGLSVSSAGDINGDGFDDVIIGSTGADPNGLSAAGESYVVFGQASGFGASFNLSTLDGTNGFVINGIDAGDRSGVAVSAAGDVNNDGFDDLIVGADSADPNGFSSGESYIIFGAAFGNGVILGTAGSDILNGTAFADNIRGFEGDDFLIGLGGDDRLEGGPGTDSLIGGQGADTFVADLTSLDIVFDFNNAEDFLDLSNILDASFTVGNLSDFVVARDIGGIGTTTIQVDSDGAANGANFIDVAFLTNVAGNNSLNIIFDSVGSTTALQSSVLLVGIFGTAGDDNLIGTGLREALFGFAGDDVIQAGDDGDFLNGGDDNDTLLGEAGNDILIGGAGTDILTGGADFDLFELDSTSVDTITDYSLTEDNLDLSNVLDPSFTGANVTEFVQIRQTGSDSIVSIDSDGTANGVNFVDAGNLLGIVQGDNINFVFNGGLSSSSVNVIGPLNNIVGTPGDDFPLDGTSGDDLISGLDGDDEIFGLGGNDELFGDAGFDVLEGGAGNDILNGGADDDELTGGTGDDIFILDDITNFETITDFNSFFENDLLDLSSLLDANFTPGLEADYIQVTESSLGDSDLFIDVDGQAGSASFVNIAFLQGVQVGDTIGFIFDDLGAQSTVVATL